MRLSDTERHAMAHALRDVSHPVYVFGSRLDDAKRGGDIDIAIFTRGLDESARFKLSIEVAVKFRSLCDEKIDVQVFDAESPAPSERCFLSTIARKRITASALAA